MIGCAVFINTKTGRDMTFKVTFITGMFLTSLVKFGIRLYKDKMLKVDPKALEDAAVATKDGIIELGKKSLEVLGKAMHLRILK